jgi:hypothetical protein
MVGVRKVKFRAIVLSIIVSAFAWCMVPNQASAQANSSGLTANAVGISYKQNQLAAQILIKNNNKVRVYILDARTDDSQLAFLGSGEHLYSPMPAGVTSCNNSYSQCIANPNEITIDKFSYIEPGDSLAIAMNYGVAQKPADHDTVSFSITFVSRFAKSDVSPEDVGPVKRLTFPFRFLQLLPPS